MRQSVPALLYQVLPFRGRTPHCLDRKLGWETVYRLTVRDLGDHVHEGVADQAPLPAKRSFGQRPINYRCRNVFAGAWRCQIGVVSLCRFVPLMTIGMSSLCAPLLRWQEELWSLGALPETL